MKGTIEGLGDMFLKWKAAFESKDLKVDLWKTKDDGQRQHHKGWLV